jgi:hypothetical protein
MSNLSSQLLRITRNILLEIRSISLSLLGIKKQVETISEQHKQPEGSEKDQPPLPPVLLMAPPDRPIEVTAQTHEHKDIWERFFEVIEAFGIFAVVAYALLTYYQLKELRKSVDAAQQTATFAYHQTIMAGNSLKATSEQFRTDQRAWIFSEATAWGFSSDGTFERVLASVRFKNSGKTPAFNVRGWSCSQVREREPPEPAPKLPMFCGDSNFGVIGPEGVFNIQRADVKTVVDPNTRNLLNQRKLRLYFWGYMQYVDGFKNPQWTRFCLQSEELGREIIGVSKTNAKMGSCEKNNYAK